MKIAVATNAEPDRHETGERPTLVPDQPDGAHDVEARSLGATRRRKIGSEPYDDPTQGRQIGSDPYDDPTQGRQIGSHPYDDPTQGRKTGSDRYDDPTRGR